MKTVAILLAYNAAGTLREFYAQFPKHLVDEIILVDDASQDNTFALARELGITAYKNPVNLGYGGNMKRALRIALERGARIIIDLHPDGEYKPGAILPALKKVDEGAQLVLGYRFESYRELVRRGMRLWKIPPLMLMNWVPRLVLRTPLKDFHQGFRVYTRALLEAVDFNKNSDNYLFSFELVAEAVGKKIPISQVPVETKYEGKKRGASFKNSVAYSLGVLKTLFKYRQTHS